MTNQVQMNSIDRIIKESIERFLIREGVSSRVYHFTSLKNAYKILSTNTMYLQSSLSGGERGQSDNIGNKPFYLCLTRNKHTALSYAQNYKDRDEGCRIEFDSDALNARFKGQPYDYWRAKGKQKLVGKDSNGEYISKYPQADKNIEMEDRLLYEKSQIHNISRYIKRIDVFVIKEDDEYLGNIELALALREMPSFQGKVFIYDNLKDFDFQTSNYIKGGIQKKIPQSLDDKTKDTAIIDARKTLLSFIRMCAPIYNQEIILQWVTKYHLNNLVDDTLVKNAYAEGIYYAQYYGINRDSIYNLINYMKNLSSRYITEYGQQVLQLISDVIYKAKCKTVFEFQKDIEKKLYGQDR